MDPESANMIVPVKADASTNNGNHQEPLVSVIRKMIEMPEPQSSTVCRIYRVPYHFRKYNNGAYSSRVVSIGPFHRDQKGLGNMEVHKVIYLKKFIEKTQLDLEKLVTIIREREESIRSCYAESLDQINKDDFVKMILLDATFILVLFLGHKSEDWKFGDPMLVHPLFAAVRFDLLLLENQLPFFVIKILFDQASPFLQNPISSLIEFTWDFFSDYNWQKKSFPSDLEIIHFTY